MRAVIFRQNGGPNVLRVEELDTPTPGEDELLVEVTAVGVNFRDILERRGGHGRPPPAIAGIEGAGKIIALGANRSDEFAVGDRVAWDRTFGSYSQYVVVDAAHAIPIPGNVSDVQAGGGILQGMTAHCLSSSAYRIDESDIVLIHAAAGGVGLLLTQLAKLRGARVIGTTSTDSKGDAVRAAGADEVIPYDNFDRRVRELTDGEGVSVVYDGLGATTLMQSISSLRRRGVVVLYGWASGLPAPFDPQVLRSGGSLTLTRASLHDFTVSRDELRACGDQVMQFISDGRLEILIGGRYSFAEAAETHRSLEARANVGKLVLLPT